MLLILSQEQENTNGCKTSVGASIFCIRDCDLSRSSPVKGLYVYVEGIERMQALLEVTQRHVGVWRFN